MKLYARPTFATVDGRVVAFHSLDRDLYPNFSHRVVINGVACDWLSRGHKANAKNARFFLEKHEK